MTIQPILSILDEIIIILNEYQVNDWSRIIEEHKQELFKALISGNDSRIQVELRDILSLFGGMGSFTDFYISEQAGYKISPDIVSSVNQNLQQLQSQLYDSIKNDISLRG